MSYIKLVQTSGACPEQYDAFVGDRQVGYLRLRHGSFTVEYPFCGGEEVYHSYTIGDGIFDESERDTEIDNAIKAIQQKLDEEVELQK